MWLDKNMACFVYSAISVTYMWFSTDILQIFSTFLSNICDHLCRYFADMGELITDNCSTVTDV